MNPDWRELARRMAARRELRKARRIALSRVWIGDSHAPFLAKAPLRRVSLIRGDELVLWLGSRLMYSISKQGFPHDVIRQLEKLRLGNAMGVFTFGEIDCRVHLPPRLRSGALDLTFVDQYVREITSLSEAVELRDVVILTPTPPSDEGVDNPEYPRGGSLSERIAVTAEVRARLLSNADARVAVLDVAEILAAEDGTFRASLTRDGCHVNVAGSDLVETVLDRLASGSPAGRTLTRSAR